MDIWWCSERATNGRNAGRATNPENQRVVLSMIHQQPTLIYRKTVIGLVLLALGFALSPVTRPENFSQLDLAFRLGPDADFNTAVLHFTLLPRLVMALLCGAALGIAGVLIQQVLRNPLAAPTTLGVAAGAQLFLGLVMLFAPALLVWRELWAMAGGVLALGLAMLMARKRGFDPLTLTLCGLIVSLYLGAINTVIMLFHHEQLASLFIWGAGELSQNDWQGVASLLPHLCITILVSLVFVRPLQALDLGTEGARALGMSPSLFRGMALLLAVYLTT